MRFVSFAAVCACLALAGCGDGKAENKRDSGVAASTGSKPVAAAGPMAMPPAVTSKDQALRIMHERHEAMEGLGKAMKTLHRELDSGKPDVNLVRAQTSTMAAVAAKIPSLFPAGTGPDVGKTRAKPEIWKQQDLFVRRSKEYLAAVQAIDAAARAGDMSKVMALHENVDKACKACHDPFRAPKD